MKYLLIFLFVSVTLRAQQPKLDFIQKDSLAADSFVGITEFNTLYTISNNTLYKTTSQNRLNYSNVQLGNITSVDIFNPLKTFLFYGNFNTVVILDNRLAEIYKIDFNGYSNYKNVSFVSSGNDNTIWVYNQETQQLELFDYKASKNRISTIPIQSDILDLTSNYNYCWLLTKDYLYQFNYFGSLVLKLKNKGFTKLKQTNENLVLQKENTLYYLEKGYKEPIPIDSPKLLINAFFVNRETLYIYTNNFLYKYQLKIN